MVSKPKKENPLLNLFEKRRSLALVMIIVFAFIVFSIVFPGRFFKTDNLTVILMNMMTEALILCGIVMVLIMGEIDLSMGANVAFAGVICGRLIKLNHAPTLIAILIPLAISLVFGLINGLIVTRIGVASFITTLATSMIFLGLTTLLAGTGYAGFPDPVFQMMGQYKIFGLLQMQIIYGVFCIGIFAYLLGRTKYFRQLYFIGGNARSSLLSGINIKKTKTVIFMISAFLSSLSGIVIAMRFNSAMVSSGTGVELRAITAAVIGGVSFLGGTGSVMGAAMGALFLSLLSNGLSMAQVPPSLQTVITGIVLILALLADSAIGKRKRI